MGTKRDDSVTDVNRRSEIEQVLPTSVQNQQDLLASKGGIEDMRIKRGLNSMRVRRRQSDAKWRAGVSSCYDTLKFVIPDSGKLPKRKISKAVVLQETDQHIIELEKAVSRLLTQEASTVNKSILWRTGKQWSLATLAHIRKEFEEKQALLFEQSTQGRRKYSMLADIEDEILHMAADTSKMTVISCNVSAQNIVPEKSKQNGKQTEVSKTRILRKELTKPCTEPRAHSTPCSKKARQNSDIDTWSSTIDSKDHIPAICERIPYTNYFYTTALNSDNKHSVFADAPITSLNTPSKMCYVSDSEKLFSPVYVADCHEDFNTPVYCYSNNRRLDVKPSISSPSLSKVAKQLDFVSVEKSSPVRPSCTQENMKEMGSPFGFTPIKLPSPGLDFTPLRLQSLQMMECTPVPATPGSLRTTYPPQTPKRESVCGESDDEETKSLLCLETFDMPEDGPEWERTPSKRTSSATSTTKEKVEKKGNCKKKIAFGAGRHSVKKNRDRVPKCRKNLEKMYTSHTDSEGEKTLPVITGVFDKDTNCSDFDGYFLYYRQVVNELQQHMSRAQIASPSVAALVSQMWSNMSSSDKETLATLAALEGSQDSNSSSELSDDLQELDVKPLDSSHFIHAERLGMFTSDLQTVPCADFKMVAATVDRVLQTYDVQEVPVHYDLSENTVHLTQSLSESADDIAIINLDSGNVDSEYSAGISDSADYMDACSSQIVPDISSIVKRDVLLSSSQSSVSFTSIL